MNLIEIIDKLRTQKVKKFAYGLLVLLILVDFIIPRHEIHFFGDRSEEHTSELQSRTNLVCRLLLEKKK